MHLYSPICIDGTVILREQTISKFRNLHVDHLLTPKFQYGVIAGLPATRAYCRDTSAGVGPAKKYRSKMPPMTLYSNDVTSVSRILMSIPLELSRKTP